MYSVHKGFEESYWELVSWVMRAGNAYKVGTGCT
jgi:hypothetical protein